MWRVQRKNPGWLLSIKASDVDAIPTERCATPVFSLSHHRLPPTMADLRTVNELIAGSVGGAAQVLVGQPLDTIKTRAQIAPRKRWLNLIPRRMLIVCGFASQGTCLYASSRLLRWEVDWGTQKGPMDVFLQTVRKEGALGLYKGVIYRVYLKSVSHPFFRDAFAPPRNRGRKLSPLRVLRPIKANRNSVRRTITSTNSPCWCYGWCCERRAC
jgi:hypothetical protein